MESNYYLKNPNRANYTFFLKSIKNSTEFPKVGPSLQPADPIQKEFRGYWTILLKMKWKYLTVSLKTHRTCSEKFEEINQNETLPPGSKPYSIDIKSFYTNILVREGIEAFRETLQRKNNLSIPVEYLVKLLKLVMESNIFKFDNDFWIQLIGTSMGTRVAPTYANLFMGKLEKLLLENCPEHLKRFLHTWKRYIDDILVIWTGSEEEFTEFFNFLNSFHATIKFDEPQHNREDNSCEFLDLKTSIEDGKIGTDLYRKDTAKPRALLPSSAHPGHITSNIVYSMGFRLMRICSTE